MKSNIVEDAETLALNSLYSDFGSVSCIKRELHSTCENAVSIGYYLSEIRYNNSWKYTDFYKNFVAEQYTTPKGVIKYTTYTFYNYCSDEFNLSRRSVDRYILIYNKCSSVNSSGYRTKFIDEKYKQYSASQLAELLYLSDSKQKLVNPGMTVKEIRALKDDEALHLDEEDDNNTDDVYDPEDVGINVQLRSKQYYRNKGYMPAPELYDKLISTSSQYTNQFVKLQEYIKQGYLVRLTVYKPGVDE